jgi:hypothetical protein
VRIDLPLREPFVVHFPRKKKARKNNDGIITLKAKYFGEGTPLEKPKCAKMMVKLNDQN